MAVRYGHHTAADAAAFRAEGERVLAEWPFPTGWEDWRPHDLDLVGMYRADAPDA